MKGLHTVALILVIIGAINWGLVGLFGFNLVEAILGSMPAIAKLVYILVGVSGLYVLIDRINKK